jgi:hypothetical protein
VKTIPRAAARPSTKSGPKMACSTTPKRASTVAATRSIESRARSGLLTLTFDISHFRYQSIAQPEELGNAGRVQWVSGRPGEAPAYAATDFIIARDGRIAAIYLFFDKLP